MATKKEKENNTTESESDMIDSPRYTKDEISEASKIALQERSSEMEIDWDTVTEYCNITIGARDQ